MKLIPNWREAWRWFSVQALAALVLLPVVWMALPPDIKGFLPDSWEPWTLMFIAGAGLIGRLVDQNKKVA
jgi:protein-S-isoprenylcysteine O-methyltransferase Ste14